MSTSRPQPSPRRELILGETLRIVGERGFNGFGIAELAERCGLTKPGLLHHFGSKDQLLIALLNEVDAKHEAELYALFIHDYDHAESPAAQRETFRRSMRAVMERTLAVPELIRLRVVLRAEALNPEHPAHDFFMDRETASLERITLRVKAFAPHPPSLARQVLALMYGLEEQWLRQGGNFDLLQEWDRGLDALLR